MTSLTLTSLAAACALAVAPASAAPVMRGVSPTVTPQNEMVQQVQWRRHHHRGYYRGGYYRGHRGNGGAIAAGVLGGLALGAIAAGAANAAPPPTYYAPQPVYGGGGSDWIAYCSSKYRSFDPASGTYLGYDGLRHPCQ